MSLGLEQIIADLLSNDPVRTDNAIEMLVTRAVDPAPILQKVAQTDLVQGRGPVRETLYEATLNTLALTYLNSGFTDFAQKILDGLISLGSTNPETYNNLGVVAYKIDDLDKAKLCWEEAADIDKQRDPNVAALLPAAQNLRRILPEIQALSKMRYFGYLIWCGAAVCLILFLLYNFRQSPRFGGNSTIASGSQSNVFLTNLVQVDGLAFAFVGTFSIFVLSGIKEKRTRDICVSYVVLPLLIFVSASASLALLCILFSVGSILNLIPYVLAVAGFFESLLLVLVINLLPFKPTPSYR